MPRLSRRTGRLPAVIPSGARQVLYELHPGRARRWRRFPALERFERGTRRAALTLDDGPDENATPAVLDALEAAGARATFFLLAEQAQRHPELALRVVESGHEIGLHGHGHARHDRVQPSESRADILGGFAALEDLLGVRPRWFRPPYGKMSDAAMATCRELRLKPVYWSAWGLDWEDVTAERIAAVTCRDLEDGAIVLLHDSARYGRRPSARPTADAIPLIERFTRDRGLALVPLGRAATA